MSIIRYVGAYSGDTFGGSGGGGCDPSASSSTTSTYLIFSCRISPP